MFPFLAEELERMIWQSFWSRFILREIRSYEPIWVEPSNDLLHNCIDIGALQHGKSDMERALFFYHGSWPRLKNDIYENCFLGSCRFCITEGFPCNDAVCCGGLNRKLQCFWDMSYYKNLLDEDEEFYLGIEYV